MRVIAIKRLSALFQLTMIQQQACHWQDWNYINEKTKTVSSFFSAYRCDEKLEATAFSRSARKALSRF